MNYYLNLCFFKSLLHFSIFIIISYFFCKQPKNLLISDNLNDLIILPCIFQSKSFLLFLKSISAQDFTQKIEVIR